MRTLLAYLRPSPTVPRLPWSAVGTQWRPRPATAVVLLVGVCLFGVGEGALVAAGLGNAPWTVLAQGVASRTPLDIGGATIVVSTLVLIGWIPLRQRPGLGTVANVVVIGVVLDVMTRVLPHPHQFRYQLPEAAAGVLVVAIGGALYLTANLGPGPRDGWMTGLHRRTGIGIATVRTTIELVVLVAGILLGGHAGLGTVMFALLAGYALAGIFRVLVWATAPTPLAPEAEAA